MMMMMMMRVMMMRVMMMMAVIVEIMMMTTLTHPFSMASVRWTVCWAVRDPLRHAPGSWRGSLRI
jgi:hypothetical protein